MVVVTIQRVRRKKIDNCCIAIVVPFATEEDHCSVVETFGVINKFLENF